MNVQQVANQHRICDDFPNKFWFIDYYVHKTKDINPFIHIHDIWPSIYRVFVPALFLTFCYG